MLETDHQFLINITMSTSWLRNVAHLPRVCFAAGWEVGSAESYALLSPCPPGVIEPFGDLPFSAVKYLLPAWEAEPNQRKDEQDAKSL